MNAFPDTELEPIFGGLPPKWRWHWHALGFRFGNCVVNGCEVATWQVPYWFVVLTLTAISAYLLLTKQSKPTQMKITEPTANDGA